MKKYLVYTSIFALAACGGGGGGHSGSNPGYTVPSELRYSTTADANNAAVTKMKSQVIVSDSIPGDLSRHGSTATLNGVTFTSYDLEDIKLGFADMAAADGYLQIGMDGAGNIDKMTMVFGEDNEGNPIGGALARVSNDSARFRGPIFEYVKDSYAKSGDSIFSVGNTDEAMRDAIVSKRGFGAGAWEQVEDDVWKYRLDGSGEFATYDNGNGVVDFSIDDGTEALQAAVRDAYGFDKDGKWVADGENLKYIEYGDEAEYRVGATDDMTKDRLDEIASEKELPALGHWNLIDEVMDIETLGRDIGNGKSLQYSDFGHFNPVYYDKLVDLTGKTGGTWNSAIDKHNTNDEVEAELGGEDYQLFAGGYAVKGTQLVDTLDVPVDPSAETKFKGKAIGRAYVSFQSNGVNRDSYLAQWDVPQDLPGAYSNDAGHDIARTFTTTNAEITIDTAGNQTLVMPFNRDGNEFYDVVVTKNAGAAAGDFAVNFTDTTASMADSQYRKNDDPDETKKAFNPGYYGVNTASEAAGTVYYRTKQDIGTGEDAGKINREWEFQGAYGMKRQ